MKTRQFGQGQISAWSHLTFPNQTGLVASKCAICLLLVVESFNHGPKGEKNDARSFASQRLE